MNTGVRAISVEAIAASAYCTAISESETPRTGPKMVSSTA